MPYSPKATVLPRVALPFILPRWLLRNFTLLGINGITIPQFQITNSLPSSTPLRTTWANVGFQNFLAIHSAIDPALDPDRAVGRERNRVSVIDIRLKRRQGNRAGDALLAAGDFSAAEAAADHHL